MTNLLLPTFFLSAYFCKIIFCTLFLHYRNSNFATTTFKWCRQSQRYGVGAVSLKKCALQIWALLQEMSSGIFSSFPSHLWTQVLNSLSNCPPTVWMSVTHLDFNEKHSKCHKRLFAHILSRTDLLVDTHQNDKNFLNQWTTKLFWKCFLFCLCSAENENNWKQFVTGVIQQSCFTINQESYIGWISPMALKSKQTFNDHSSASVWIKGPFVLPVVEADQH